MMLKAITGISSLCSLLLMTIVGLLFCLKAIKHSKPPSPGRTKYIL
jgi:hypothetical protein